jgi:hypothetical protein
MAPKADPRMMMNSDHWRRTAGWPPAIMKPPRTETKTMTEPMMTSISGKR